MQPIVAAVGLPQQMNVGAWYALSASIFVRSSRTDPCTHSDTVKGRPLEGIAAGNVVLSSRAPNRSALPPSGESTCVSVPFPAFARCAPPGAESLPRLEESSKA